MKNKEDLKELLEYYRKMPTISCDADFYKFCNLEPGMIINYKYNDIVYKMIILDNYGTDLEVIVGLEGEMYRDFKPMNLPSDILLEYEIVGTLNDQRLEKLRMTNSENLLKGCYIKK